MDGLCDGSGPPREAMEEHRRNRYPTKPLRGIAGWASTSSPGRPLSPRNRMLRDDRYTSSTPAVGGRGRRSCSDPREAFPS